METQIPIRESARGAEWPLGRGPYGGEDEGVRAGAAGAGRGGGVRGVDAGGASAARAVCRDRVGMPCADGEIGRITGIISHVGRDVASRGSAATRTLDGEQRFLGPRLSRYRLLLDNPGSPDFLRKMIQIVVDREFVDVELSQLV